MAKLDLACRCGKTRLVLDAGRPARAQHLVCYCTDCRGHARDMGAADSLQPGGGAAIFHALPSRLGVTDGAENLACLRRTRKGPLRWYAACCGTPIAATLDTASLPFAGVVVGALASDAAREAALGPVTAELFKAEAEPGAPAARKPGVGAAMTRMIPRLIGAVLRGDTRSPFFDGKRPVAVPREDWRAAGR